jgi:hypothetical protein
VSLIEAHANTARRVKNVKNTINRFGDRLLYEAQVRGESFNLVVR